MVWSIALFGVMFLFASYKRWIPVRGITSASLPEPPLEKDMIILDIRDYQDSDRHPIHQAYTLPYPYLKRHIQTIETKKVFLVAPDKVSKNLSIRLLKKYGYEVTHFAVLRDHSVSSPTIKVG